MILKSQFCFYTGVTLHTHRCHSLDPSSKFIATPCVFGHAHKLLGRLSSMRTLNLYFIFSSLYSSKLVNLQDSSVCMKTRNTIQHTSVVIFPQQRCCLRRDQNHHITQKQAALPKARSLAHLVLVCTHLARNYIYIYTHNNGPSSAHISPSRSPLYIYTCM